MNNFLQFIEEDIISKKSLISAMPTNNKTNIRKFNEKLNDEITKYAQYKESIKKYLMVKCKSFEIKDTKEPLDLSELISDLEKHRFILNPANTYFEKMGFDSLFYKMTNYNEFNFDSLNELINEFISKFDEAGIVLNPEDFNYTTYVKEFMGAFLRLKDGKENAHDELAAIFEKIYWESPEIILHIELNFRKLIKKYEKKFTEHINSLQRLLVNNKGLKYKDCLEKITEAYRDVALSQKESIVDIVNLAKSGKIDISGYFADSKTRISIYDSLMIAPLNIENPSSIEAFYENLEKLKTNIIEYHNYLNLKALFDDFKTKYMKSDGIKTSNNNLKDILARVYQKEKQLEKLNKGKSGFKLFGKKNIDPKNNKFEITKLANEIHELYKTSEEEYFKEKINKAFNNSFMVSDILNLYYSFDFFKKKAIKEAFRLSNYDETIEYSNMFNVYALNPLNIIANIVAINDSSNIAKIIVNKYRLTNINISEDELNSDNLNSVIDKIDMVLRIRIIEKSPLNVEKIWFMAQVEKLLNNDKTY